MVTGRLGLNTASQGFNKTRGDHIAIKENLSPDQNPESVTPNYYDPFGDQNYKIQYF